MSHALRLGIAAVLLSGLFTSSALAADAAILVIDSVKVRTTKKDGKPWDFGGGAPDLRVRVERTSKPAGEIHVTAPRSNSFSATFDRPALGVSANDVIEIRVLDEDGAVDDEAGRQTVKITRTMLKSGRLELSFDQVSKLVLRFKR